MSSSSTDDSSDVESWIEWFLLQEGHEFFCEVDRNYIEDNFNLYGLRTVIPHFRTCLNIILDVADSHTIDHESNYDQHAMDLYGLIHARYILTKRGMERMLRKYRIGEFGICPCMECAGQPVLPVGLKDQLRYHEVMVYCARCNNIFYPANKQQNYREEHLDGAYFGSTFAHLLLMQYPALRPSPPRPSPKYVPKVFGFKIRLPNSNNNNNSSSSSSSSSSSKKKNSSQAKLKDSSGSGRLNKASSSNVTNNADTQDGDTKMTVVEAPVAKSSNQQMPTQ